MSKCGCRGKRLCSYHEGVADEQERIIELVHAAANEAKELWESERYVDEPYTWKDYWRGQMNGLHHIICDIEGREHD